MVVCGKRKVTQEGRNKSQSNVITHLMYDGADWHAQLAVDKLLHKIVSTSLDSVFMGDCIRKCRRNHGRLVPVPNGKAPGAEHGRGGRFIHQGAAGGGGYHYQAPAQS